MLSLGNSVPWQDALEQLTGTREMSARPILEVIVVILLSITQHFFAEKGF
jgi:hypothetical protein